MAVLCNCASCPSRSKSIMADIPEDILNELTSLKVTNVYKKGQTIFYEGNRPYGVYCLKNGKVKLYKTNADGKDLIVNLASTGALLGYRYFFTNEMYSATAEVLEDATVCFLDKEKFLELLKKYPPLSLKLLNIMGQEMRKSEINVTSMAYNSTNERIVAMILHLKETYGVKYDDNNHEFPSWKIDISLSRNDLASLAGTTTETMVRTISWLKEKNMVKTINKFLHITDLNALEKMVPEY